jgi:hypothetical protein
MPKLSKLDWKQCNPNADLVYSMDTTSKTHENKSVRVLAKVPGEKPQPIYIQAPPLVLKFGVEEKEIPTAKHPNAKKYYAPLTFPTVRKDEDGKLICDQGYQDQLGFVNFLYELDEANMGVAFMNVRPWFNKPMKKDVLEELYYKNLRKPKEEQKFSPTFSTKLIYNNDKEEFTTKMVDKKGNPIGINDLVKGCTVVPLLKTHGLWFAGKSFGMSFQIAQIMVIDTPDIYDELAIEYKDPNAMEEEIEEDGQGYGIDYEEPSAKRQRS